MQNPSPDRNGNPFVAVFAAKDCIGEQEIASNYKKNLVS